MHRPQTVVNTWPYTTRETPLPRNANLATKFTLHVFGKIPQTELTQLNAQLFSHNATAIAGIERTAFRSLESEKACASQAMRVVGGAFAKVAGTDCYDMP